MAGTRVAMLLAEIEAARRYTLGVLDRVGPGDFFRMPPGGVTHVAWQVGHLAVAQFNLALLRTRGPRPDDAAILADDFRAAFGRGSTPDPDPASYPPADAIREALDRVHRRVGEELAGLDAAALDEPSIGPPHPIATTREAALRWCAHHEFLHAGQIILVRRLLGGAPNW